MSIEVRQLTVGPVAENCYLVDRKGRGLVVDPGDEPERILAEAEEAETSIEAILVTHCHFDHIGAVAPVAEASGAPVYCPEMEAPLLADIMAFVPFEGVGPYESYDADVTLGGGETLELAGLTLDTIAVPGHAPGHVAYSVRDESALFSGDVLFAGSVGRVDLPGGDGPTLIRSIEGLIESLPPETRVYPGHMGVTTLAAERATNPFLKAQPN
jgi:hydroxyacylglutathione hydrolase